MRCVPFLMLAYIVYYGLPSLAAISTISPPGSPRIMIYNSAYMGEILRGAWTRLPPDYTQAARAFGFHGFTLYRRIILPPIFFAAAPVIGNQIIQVIKDTAFLMIIAVPELTLAASSIQSTYFVPFAAFCAAMLLYWMLCAHRGMGRAGHRSRRGGPPRMNESRPIGAARRSPVLRIHGVSKSFGGQSGA